MTVREAVLASENIAITNRSTTSEHSTLLVLGLSTVAIFSNMYATQPILPVIGLEFGLQPSEAGITVSALVLAIAVSALFYGILSDRIGRRPVIVGSAFALVVPTLLCGLAPTFLTLVICRIGQGLILPGFIATTITYIHEEFATNRGLAVGWYTAATVTGGFTGRLQGGVMTDLFNWRFAFFSFALANLISGLALARYLPPSRHKPVIYKSEGFDFAGLIACFRNKRLIGCYLVGMAIFFPFIGLFTYLPYYLTRPPFNLSTLLVSFVFVVYLIGVFAAPLSGRFSDRLGRSGVISVGLLLMAIGVGLTLIPWLPVVFIGLLILCFGMFTAQSNTNAFIGDSVGKGQSRGSAVSLYQMFFYTSGSLGGVIPGLLWQNVGWSGVVIACLSSLTVGIIAARSLWR